MSQQLIQPNFSVIGTVGMCEQYVEHVFGQSQLARCAWDAWVMTPIKHIDNNLPTDVAFLAYFSYTATIQGETRNWGHVVSYDPAKHVFKSSPWQAGTTHADLDSIEQIESLYTTHQNGQTQPVKFVGWSEYLANVKVAEVSMEETITKSDMDNMWDWMYGHPPVQADYDTWVGKSFKDWSYNKARLEFYNLREQVAAAPQQTATPATPKQLASEKAVEALKEALSA